MNAEAECIFCRIVAGEVPAAKVLEDDSSIAFLDIGPVAAGHTLLIPRKHVETLDELSDDDAAGTLRHLPRLVRAVRVATGCEGLNVLQNNGRVAQQFVPHVHFHLIPRNAGDEFHFNWPAGTYPDGQMESMAEKIRQML
ncbi:MAG: HIT family protein [Phycisphaerae bacterium]